MPSHGSKSPLAPSTKTHSFLRKSTGESLLIKTTHTSVPVEVRTSQSTNSLSSESNNNESDHHGNSLIILKMKTTSPMTKNPPERKLRIFAPISAGGMIPIHHSIKLPFGSGIICILDSLTRESNQKEEGSV